MSTLREAAMRQALDALLSIKRADLTVQQCSAISELEAALAEPEAPAHDPLTKLKAALLAEAEYAEFRDKHIHYCNGPVVQNWLVHLYVPVPAESDVGARQAMLDWIESVTKETP